MEIKSNLLDDPFQAINSRFDRRHERRIPLRIPIRIFRPGATGRRYQTALCTNISEDGLAFETDAVLDLDSKLDIEFHQSGQPVFRRHVALLYRSNNRYGAYFAGL
jgi:hypothetical protein